MICPKYVFTVFCGSQALEAEAGLLVSYRPLGFIARRAKSRLISAWFFGLCAGVQRLLTLTSEEWPKNHALMSLLLALPRDKP